MNTNELISSIKRYVEVYYDVVLDDKDESFSQKVIQIFQTNDDPLLEEYWEEYALSRDLQDHQQQSRVGLARKNNLFAQAVAKRNKEMTESS